MSELKGAESKVRRAAKRVGWRIEKSRTRNLHCNDRGMYQLIDDRNSPVEGINFDATLDQCAYWIGREYERLFG